MAVPVAKVNPIRCPYVDPESGQMCKAVIRKVELEWTKCKCEQTFCLNHRLPFNHNCTYDYKRANKAALEKKIAGQEAVLKANIHEKVRR